MKTLPILKNFPHDEDGAVTVDWVVLTAAIVGLALGAMASLMDATDALTSDINTGMENTAINSSDE